MVRMLLVNRRWAAGAICMAAWVVLAAALDEAVLDGLDATVLDAAALGVTALDAVVLCAAGFDEEGLAAADARARGCGGAG
jgi:hypothetical protein